MWKLPSVVGCARRPALDLTQDDLARQVGCAIITIQKLEADERRPSRQLAERLADTLMVLPDDRAALITLARAEPTEGTISQP
ncbi:MAG TPA: helix-turn-helix transcriptional regulator [Roseiflexaceae bacterium]|nr:helix-turn-helix transcriptional regulator [Roseiflexaceae bacterium]